MILNFRMNGYARSLPTMFDQSDPVHLENGLFTNSKVIDDRRRTSIALSLEIISRS
jgi:hypothetical protein